MAKKELFSIKGRQDALVNAPVSSERVLDAKNLKINILQEFKDHPFAVRDDVEMEELIMSISEHNILNPILVRPIGDKGNYEIVSGHRRCYAAKKLGISTVPAIIRTLTDDEATIIMVDSNIQRTNVLPSERARAIAMKIEALKHQGKKLDDFPPKADQAGESFGRARRMAYRYSRLIYLTPALMARLDKDEFGVMAGYELSYLDIEAQGWVDEYLAKHFKLSTKMAERIRKEFQAGNLTKESILPTAAEGSTVKPVRWGQTEKRFRKYFPKEYTVNQMETVIIELLDKWQKEQNNEGKI